MKKIKVGGGGIDANGEWYRYEEEIEMTDEEHAAWMAGIRKAMTATKPDNDKILMSEDAYQAFLHALDTENPKE